MKKINILFFVIILLMGSRNFTFASYRINKTNDEMKDYLQEVFDQRIEIWNDFVINQNMDLKNIESRLKKYTVEPLLTIDLKNFQYIIQNPSSYEIIKNVYIKECKLQDSNIDYRTYLVSIGWELLDHREVKCEEFDYIIELIKEDDKWLLKNYELNL